MTRSSFLGRLSPWSRPARRRAQTTRLASTRLLLEPLEERSLLSGSPPVVLIDGPPTVAEAPYSYTLNLTAVDPENDPVTQWTIDWGDGTVQTIPGNPSSLTHAYATSP